MGDKTKKRPYYVMWTYIANYTTTPIEVWASTAKEAGDIVFNSMSEDFRRMAHVNVTRERPKIFTNSKA